MDKLESLQIDHGDGPCITAFNDKELVSCEDLSDESRWGDFSARAVDDGLRAVLLAPSPMRPTRSGGRSLFRQAHAWTPEGELALTSFTDLAALAIATTLQSEERGELASQLEKALDARVAIEQAKGVLMAQEGIGPREAFEQLRRQARRSRRRLSVVAGEVVKEARKGEGS